MKILTTTKSKDVEQRAFLFDIRAEHDEERGDIITGRPIVYDSRTDIGFFDEIIQRGALDGCDLKDVAFFVNHDVRKIPLARSRNNNANSTMQLSVDDNGLSIRVNLDTENNAEARALFSAVGRGDITGMSFMFRVDDEEWQNLESDHPTRIIKRLAVVREVSAVNYPAYQDTEINVQTRTALDNARAALDSARDAKNALDSANKLELEKLKLKYLYN